MNSSGGAVPKVPGGGGARPKIRRNNGTTFNTTNVESNNCLNSSSPKGHFSEIQSNLLQKNEDNCAPEVSCGSSYVPLDQKEIMIYEGGVQIKRSALHENFAEKKSFVSYVTPPLHANDQVVGAIEAWTEQMEFMIEDLTWLLNLSHYRFWSQMVYDKSTQESLVSYLGHGPRWYDELPEDEICLSLINKIHQLVFLIYLRMSTHKESIEHYISTEFFGNLIYDNFLFDLCKILDLCSLYGSSNGGLLRKMISNIFNQQPKYYRDLDQLVLSLEDALQNIQMRVLHSDSYESSMGLHSNQGTSLDLLEIDDIVQYLLDTFSSLHIFLDIFTPGGQTFHKRDFELGLCNFYEKVIPVVMDRLFHFVEEFLKDVKELTDKINSMRTSCLALFRILLSNSCLPTPDDQVSDDQMSKKAEIFIQTLSTCAEDKIFITDYHSTYDVNEDIQLFEKAGADMTTLNFVREAVNSAVEETKVSSQLWDLTDETLELIPEDDLMQTPPSTDAKDEVNVDSSGMNGYYSGESSLLSDIEIASLITCVLDLLPDLGHGFVNECLKHFNYSTEEVLNALLEDNLPPHLKTLDRAMPMVETTQNDSKASNFDNNQEPMRSPERRTSEPPSCSDVLVNRSNIYDDDEFDVFSSRPNIDMQRVFKGKNKDTTVSFDKDSTLTNKIKAIAHEYDAVSGYSIYEDEEKYIPMASNDYDDEYDDTYDDNEAGDIDNFTTDKRYRKPAPPTLRGKGALNVKGLDFMGDDSSSEEDNEETQNEPKENTFRRMGGTSSSSTHRTAGNQVTSKTFNNSSRRRPPPSDSGKVPSSGERRSLPPQSHPPSGQEFNHRNNQFKSTQSNRSSNTQHQSQDVRVSDCQNGNSRDPESNSYPRKGSNKNWRQDENEGERRHGGKRKEESSSTHGKAQDPKYKYKMIHKSDHRKNAAQAKYRSNF